MISRITQFIVGAGLACGVLCALPLVLAALGISGAAAFAAAYGLDELLFCSPLAPWLGVLAFVGIAVGYSVHRYRARSKSACGCPTTNRS
jgi:hypothetical protein